MAEQDKRVPEIDGIRGWAALLVLVYHFYQETFGALFPGLHAPGWGFVFDGRLAVLIFFVLSGDALSVSWFRSGDTHGTARLAIARYFRLVFPAVITCFAVYALMHLGLAYNIQAAKILHRMDWIGGHIAFEPTFGRLTQYVFSDLFFDHKFHKAFNPFLWTLEVEMVGSLMVFSCVLVLSQVRHPLRLLAVTCALLAVLRAESAVFLVGMLFGALRIQGFFARIQRHRLRILAPVGFLAAIVAISLLHESPYTFHGFELSELINQKRVHPLWAILLVFLAYSSSHLVGLFRSRLSQFLGEISFPVYAVQFPVLVSLTSYLVIWSDRAKALDGYRAFLIGTVSIAVSILLAIPLRGIERKFLRWVNGLISSHVLKPRGVAPAPARPVREVARSLVAAE